MGALLRLGGILLIIGALLLVTGVSASIKWASIETARRGAAEVSVGELGPVSYAGITLMAVGLLAALVVLIILIRNRLASKSYVSNPPGRKEQKKTQRLSYPKARGLWMWWP